MHEKHESHILFHIEFSTRIGKIKTIQISINSNTFLSSHKIDNTIESVKNINIQNEKLLYVGIDNGKCCDVTHPV